MVTFRRTLIANRSKASETYNSNLRMNSKVQSRTVTTLTRQPEVPEEPEVFSGGEPPSIILTDRAIAVSPNSRGEK